MASSLRTSRRPDIGRGGTLALARVSGAFSAESASRASSSHLSSATAVASTDRADSAEAALPRSSPPTGGARRHRRRP